MTTTIIDDINSKIHRLKKEAELLNYTADMLTRLLPLVGKSSAIIGDSFEGRYTIVEVGDTVFSKYGDVGVITRFENIDADDWYNVKVHFQADDGTLYSYSADRLN